MYSARTTYELCKSARDYRVCHAFFKEEANHPRRKEEGLPDYGYEKIEAPTIRAMRDGKCVGVLASRRYGSELAATPAHVAYHLKNHVPVMIRLIDAYEDQLRIRKIPHYKILLPSYKPSVIRIFEEYKHGILFNESEDKKLRVYIIPVVI